MKKKISIITIIILAIACVVLLSNKGVLTFDRSAERTGNSVIWNGTTYVRCVGSYHEDKRIAKTTDGYDIIEIEEDKTHTFIVLRSFLDQQLFVDQSYHIPQSGEVTSVSWNGKKITDEVFCNTVENVINSAFSDFQFETDGIYQFTENQQMREVYIGYDNCPVSTKYIGYMGMVNGTWYITTEISDDQRNLDGSPKEYTVFCYTIPQEHIDTLEKYWN